MLCSAYIPLNGANGPVPDHSQVPLEPPQAKPKDLFVSSPGAKRSEAIDSLCSQTKMPRKVATSWMHGMPKHAPVV